MPSPESGIQPFHVHQQQRDAPFTITAAASDICGTASCKIMSVSSNEPPNSNALATGDAVKTGNLTLHLRGQRNIGGTAGNQALLAMD
jgi:hypothetical protein